MTESIINEADYIAISKLSELTGVNSVTIRAWERRYGLLKPLRTPKGHRLYSSKDVEVIQEVQGHLKQGIAISKIKNLIQQSTSLQTDENWHLHGENLMSLINSLNGTKLENALYELTTHYPPQILWEYLIEPLHNELKKQKENYGIKSKHLLLISSISKQTNAFIKSHTKDLKETVLIIGINESDITLESYFITMEITNNGMKPILDFYCTPIDEIPFIADKIKPCAIILHGNATLSKQFIVRDIVGKIKKLNIPIIVTGNAAIVNEVLLAEQGLDHIADHLELINVLRNRVMGHE